MIQEESLARAIDQTHLIFAISVAILSTGISLSGMSIVVEMRWLWVTGLIVEAVGGAGVVFGIISML